MPRGCASRLSGLFFLATLAFAQVIITSSIVGTVTDPNGAMVPTAKVTLTNVDTGVHWSAATDTTGNFQFANLIAGHYTVQVEQAGFAQTVSTPIALQNGTTQRINIALKLGQIAQTVEVTGTTALMQTDDANVSNTIQQEMINDLPMEGRNYLNFAQILPNFNSGTGDTSRLAWGLASATMPGGMQLNVGGTEYGVGYYVDGLNNNDNWVEGPVMNVNQDTIQEVKADISNYSAEYGRDVGQINVTTKSGTNKIHGTAYDTLQNAGMNAVDPYSKFQGIERSPYHQNQYGFTVGGPVYIPKVFNGKDKLFFFGSFEQLRNRGQSQFTTYVPTEAERHGDFSEWLNRFPVDPAACDGSADAPPNCRYVIYNPATYDPATQLRQPFPNNVIPNPNPSALAYLKQFPLPNGYVSPDPNNFNNYSGNIDSGIDNNNYTARVDYNISSRDNIYFRYLHDSGTRLGSGGLVPDVSMGNGPHHSVNTYQGHYVHTFSPTFNNELSLSWTRAYNFSNDPTQANAFTQAGWLQSLFQNASTGMAGFTDYDKSLFKLNDDSTFSVNLGGIGSGLSLGSTEYWYQWVPIFQFSDNVAKIFGRHTLKFGFYMARRYERDNDIIRSVNFGNGYTGKGPNIGDGSGNGIAEFETGFVSSMNQRTPATGGDASLYFGMPEYAAYVNDTWNVRPSLTLSFGLRYDLPIPAYGVNNYWGVLDSTYPGGRMVMPGLTPGTDAHPFPADKNDLAPRIGVAYRLGDKTVIRSGYGMFFETGRFKFLDQVFWNSPGYGGASYESASMVPDPAMTFYTLGDVWPTATTVTRGTWPLPLGDLGGTLCFRCDTSTVDANTWAKTSSIQRWSLDIQRQIGQSVVATVGYVGSKGTHLPIQYDLNLPSQGIYLNSDDFYQARPLTTVAPDRWGAVNTVALNRNNNYNALNAQLKTRFWHGLTSQLSYTWSKQLDTFFGSNGEGGTHALGNQWHPEWSYGPSDANHAHRFVATVVYMLPGSSLTNRAWREIAGGWQINAIATFESGAPMMAWNGYTSSYDYMGDVPIRTCNGNLPGSERTFTRYFDTGCFVEPAASTDPSLIAQGITNFAVTRGNESRNSLTGPGINNWDIGIEKTFSVFGESRKLIFRADSFNVFNHAQWSSVNTYDDRAVNDQSEFGWITGARPGRRMQLNFRFVF
jgi:hypothetical protein